MSHQEQIKTAIMEALKASPSKSMMNLSFYESNYFDMKEIMEALIDLKDSGLITLTEKLYDIEVKIK